MKFYIVKLLLVLLYCLSVILCTGQDDLDVCKRTCDEELLPRIDAIVRNHSRTISDYYDMLPYWTTCQYRCFRCHLPGGIRSIDRMKTRFDKHQYAGMAGLAYFLSDMNAVIHSLKWSCYTLWQNAINDGDSTSTFS